MFTYLSNFFGKKAAEERGASAVEYALIAGLIAVAIIVTAELLGLKISDVFTNITDKLPAGS
jgi:pilus assembly protein Flp/PilA